MHPRIQILPHFTKTIFYFDFSNLHDPEHKNLVNDSHHVMQACSSDLYVLINFEKTVFSPSSISAHYNTIRKIKTRLKKVAIFGMTTMQHAFVKSISRLTEFPFSAFTKKEDALAWLDPEDSD